MKGKKGPVPEPLQTTDPNIEEIVGAENIVDVDSEEESEEAELPPIAGYKCANCSFRSMLLSEMEEHVNGTGHGKFDTEDGARVDAVQPALFSEPGVIHRMVNVMLPSELLQEKRARLASLYQSALEIKEEKKATDDDCNARLKNIDTQMQEIARILKTPYTYEKVDCEWRILNEENARGLYRLDTGEMIEKQPLSMEDKLAEEEKAAAQNAEPVERREPVTEQA